MSSMLIVVSGLPGTGKTSVARGLARVLDAVHLRIDTIEQALRSTGGGNHAPDTAGYVVAHGIAADNLRIGRIVVADCVNPLASSRAAWRTVARREGVAVVEVELICSDRNEHRRRVEARRSDISGLEMPSWDEVAAREYDSWEGDPIVIDTAHRPVEASVLELHTRLLVRARSMR